MIGEFFVTINECLQKLVGKTLSYAIKSPDMELYDFGFGIDQDSIKEALYILHLLCRFRIVYTDKQGKSKLYTEDTSSKKFHCEILPLIGQKVKRIGTNEVNDIFIDYGAIKMIVLTNADNEESWRYFSTNKDLPHLVVSHNGAYLLGNDGIIWETGEVL